MWTSFSGVALRHKDTTGNTGVELVRSLLEEKQSREKERSQSSRTTFTGKLHSNYKTIEFMSKLNLWVNYDNNGLMEWEKETLEKEQASLRLSNIDQILFQ